MYVKLTRNWFSGSHLLEGEKPHSKRKVDWMHNSTPFTPANYFSLRRCLQTELFENKEWMTSREFSHFWTDALKVFESEWSHLLVQSRRGRMIKWWYDLRCSWKAPLKNVSPMHKLAVGFEIPPLEIHSFGSFRVSNWTAKISERGDTLYFDLLKLYQIVFLIYSSLRVRFWRMEPQEEAWRTGTKRGG